MKFRLAEKIVRMRSPLTDKWFYLRKAREKLNTKGGRKRGWFVYDMTEPRKHIVGKKFPVATK